MSATCKCCGKDASGPMAIHARLGCCGSYAYWCGTCQPRPFPTFDAYLVKFKKLHAVVCEGKR